MTKRVFLEVLLPLVLCLTIFSSVSCRQFEPTPISLLDQVAPSEPLGPWRTIAEIRGMKTWANGSEGLGITIEGEVIDVQSISELRPRQFKLASRVMEKGGAFVQTSHVSSFRHPITVGEGERVLLGLRYGASRSTTPNVTMMLLKSGRVVSSVDATVSGQWAEAIITVPVEGADEVAIQHSLDPGAKLPLKNATLLAVDSKASQNDISRAFLFLRLARENNPFQVSRITSRRVFPLELNRRTLETLLLSSGESREYEVPSSLTGGSIRFWYTVLARNSSGAATLNLEVKRGNEWYPIKILPVVNEGFGDWTTVDIDKQMGLPSNCTRIRFTLPGDDSIVGVSGPLVLKGKRPNTRKNLLIIDLDTLRADRMGVYGYSKRPTTDSLDAELTQRGFFLFDNAYSPAPSTLPATAKFLSGRYHDIQQKKIVPRGYTFIQEYLRKAGYYCVAFTGGGQLRHQGFEQGFHEYFWSNKTGKIEDSFPQAIAWLQSNSHEQFFLFLHTYETHAPYTRDFFCRDLPTGRLGNLSAGELLIPRGSRIRTNTPLSKLEMRYVDAAYDSCVKKATDEVVALLHELDRLRLSDNTVVVILSDHGEEFWDHSKLFSHHGHSLYGELLNIPFIIYDPDHPGVGLQRIHQEVSTVDLLPTLLDLLKLSFSAETDGISLASLLQTPNGNMDFNRKVPILASRMDKSYCVIKDGVKYIHPPPPRSWDKGPNESQENIGELYRLDIDPQEKTNLVDLEPGLHQQMIEMLKDAMSRALPPLNEETVDHGPANPGLERQLKALGYLE